jgi:hypothetical protein
MRLLPVVAVLVAVLGAGCSSRQVYDSTQALRVEDCRKREVADPASCEDAARATYDENEKRGQR